MADRQPTWFTPHRAVAMMLFVKYVVLTATGQSSGQGK